MTDIRQKMLMSVVITTYNRSEVLKQNLDEFKKQTDKNFEVLHSTSNAYICFPMNVNKKPFNDPNVRLAIKHSCNRHEIVKAVFLGQGTIGNDHPLKPSHRMYNNGIEAIDYNPKKGFEKISWEEANKIIVKKINETSPDKIAGFTGDLTNMETLYVAK